MAIKRMVIKDDNFKLTHRCKSHIEAFEKITNKDLLVVGVKLPTIFTNMSEAIYIVKMIANGHYEYLTGREEIYIYSYDLFVTDKGYVLTRPRDIFVTLLKHTSILETLNVDDDIKRRRIEYYVSSIIKTSKAILTAVRELNS